MRTCGPELPAAPPQPRSPGSSLPISSVALTRCIPTFASARRLFSSSQPWSSPFGWGRTGSGRVAGTSRWCSTHADAPPFSSMASRGTKSPPNGVSSPGFECRGTSASSIRRNMIEGPWSLRFRAANHSGSTDSFVRDSSRRSAASDVPGHTSQATTPCAATAAEDSRRVVVCSPHPRRRDRHAALCELDERRSRPQCSRGAHLTHSVPGVGLELRRARRSADVSQCRRPSECPRIGRFEDWRVRPLSTAVGEFREVCDQIVTTPTPARTTGILTCRPADDRPQPSDVFTVACPSA